MTQPTMLVHEATATAVAPLKGSAERSVIVTSRLVGTALPRAVAEALADAGIEADVTYAKRLKADLLRESNALKVRKPEPPTIPVVVPGIGGEVHLSVEEASAMHEALTHALVKRDRAERWDTPLLGVGARVERTGIQFYDRRSRKENQDGGSGWQYEPGAIATVLRTLSDGRIMVRVDGDRPTSGERTWRKDSFRVIA